MVEIKRKKGETFESFLRRFRKKLMQSGKIIQYKKIRYQQSQPSRNMTKKSALRKLSIREKREYLKKIGRLPEEDYRGRRRR